MRTAGNPRLVAIATVILLGLAVHALIARADATALFQPTFETVPCPPDVTILTEQGSVLFCGYLTALEDRSDPLEGTVRLFVVIAGPKTGSTLADPIFVPGRDLVGRSPSSIPFGYRVDRLVITMDRRGAGRSEPSLACPEVRALTAAGTDLVLGSPQTQDALLDAVQACHDRLTSQGVDLDEYNLAQMAADAEDLRVALGIAQWNLISYGTASAISFEILRTFPEHIRSATFDSPLPPTIDRFTGAIMGTDYAFDQVVDACTVRPPCHRAYPRLHAAWRGSLRRLNEHPSAFSDEDIHIVVDDAMAVRYLRNNMAQGINESRDIREFPLAVTELRKHGWENGGPAGNEVGWASTPPFYTGYEVQWGDPGVIQTQALATTWLGQPSEGTFYSYMCHDEIPFVDQPALAAAAGDRPWYVDAYVDSPYAEICDRWNVGIAETDPHAPVSSDVPALVMSGRFDPYSPYPLVRRGTKGLEDRLIFQIPARSRNVLSVDCTVELRNAFVTDPTGRPDTTCLADIPRIAPITFLPPPPGTRQPRPGEAVITTVAGDGAHGSSGDGNVATAAQLAFPSDVVVGADGTLFILEEEGRRVREVDAATRRISTVVGTSTGIAPAPPGAAHSVDLSNAGGLGIDDEGNLYIGGGNGTRRIIIRVDPGNGQVTLIAGTGEKGDSGDGGPATEATMAYARDIAVDADGNVYFADFANNRVRVIDTSGVIHPFAGTGEKGFSGDGGPATEAMLDHPSGIALDDYGNLYIADRLNHRVRRVDASGIITTIAGNGEDGYSGDGGPATNASLHPAKVAVDSQGNVYIRGAPENRPCGCIRMVDRRGVIATVVGRRTQGFSGDGGPAKLAQLSCCGAIAFGPDGALYIADEDNWRIRKVAFP